MSGRSLIVGLVASLMLQAAPLSAQSSRAEEIARQQAEKAKQLGVEDAPAGERVVVRVMGSPLLSGSGGVYPWFGSVFKGSGFAAGLGYLHRGSGGQRLSLAGAGSINGSLMADAALRLPRLTTALDVRPFVDARRSRIQSVAFHGTGSRSDDDDDDFHYRPRQLNAGLTAVPTRWLSLAGGYGYFGFDTEAEDQDEQSKLASAPGFATAIRYGVAAASATLDWRTSPGYSTHGGSVRGGWRHFGAARDTPYSFDELEVEATQLVPLVREQYVLAFRVLATTTATDAGESVPFVLLPDVGGGDTVRAAANRRFQDRSRLVLNGEYRWRASRYLDMAMFLDSGAVAPRLADIDDARFFTGWGIGARMHGPSFTALRIEAARGREGWRLIFAASPPF